MSSAAQRTLVLLKPDCVLRHLVGPVLTRFEQKGLRLLGMKLLHAARPLVGQHYEVHKGKPFYESLVEFLSAGPTVAMVWEGREAIAVVRQLIGPTDGAKAPPGTIRGDYGLSIQNNLVHASDSPESAALEIGLWFKAEELIDWTKIESGSFSS